MSRSPVRLSTRLMVSYVLVVVVGAVATVVTVRLLVPRLFDDQAPVPGAGSHGQGGTMRDAVVSALNRSLVVATVISLVLAGVVAWFVTRRIVRPLDEVRATTRALADGAYEQRVEPPRAPELAALAHDVNELAATLDRTEERRRALVTELSHEMRTPITTVAGFLEGFLDGVIEPTPETLDEVLGEVRRLERLTDDLGLLSRLDEGTLELRRRRIDLGEIVDSVVARLRPQFDAASTTLSVRGAAAVVEVDPDRIAQVLTNVLGNALRYGAHRVEVELSSDETSVSCRVVDDGPGMSAGELHAVFERFHRGTASAGRPGSGVGLTIARSMSRAHGGDLIAMSDGPGLGATFELRLPRVG